MALARKPVLRPTQRPATDRGLIRSAAPDARALTSSTRSPELSEGRVFHALMPSDDAAGVAGPIRMARKSADFAATTAIRVPASGNFPARARVSSSLPGEKAPAAFTPVPYLHLKPGALRVRPFFVPHPAGKEPSC
ncbi:hypothetical protein NBRC116586_25880 [Pseudooceanicola nitratireducens]